MAFKTIEERQRYQRRTYFKKLSAIDALKNKPCMDCGQKFPPECMDFDHRPNEIKTSKVSLMIRYSMTNLQNEIAKCDLVCANCHRIRTRKRVVLK